MTDTAVAAAQLVRLSPQHPTWHLQVASEARTACGRDLPPDAEMQPLWPRADRPARICARCRGDLDDLDHAADAAAAAEAAPAPGLARAGRPLLSDDPVMDGWAMLDVDEIDDAPDNPRRSLGDLTELIDSIRAHGLLEPLLVTPRDGRYLLVCGARRLAAVRYLELPTVAAIIRELTEPERLSAMLVENIQRSSLTPLEEAHGYARLLQVDPDATQRDLAKLTGVSQKTISNRLALLELPAEVVEAVDTRGITIKQAEQLHKLVDAGVPERAAQLTTRKLTGQLPAWRSLEEEIGEALQEVQDARKAEQARADLEAKGIIVLTKPKGGWHNRAPRPLGQRGDSVEHTWCISYQLVDVALEEHQALACHAAAVCEHGEVVWMCRDPQLHATKAQKRHQREEERQRERLREEERQRKRRVTDRTETARRLLEVGVGPADGQLPIGQLFLDLTHALAEEVWVEVLKLAGDLLGLKPDQQLGNNMDGWRAAIAQAITDDPDRTALALLLATGERHARESSWRASSPLMRRHFGLLEGAGYQPSDEERAKLTPPAEASP